MKNVADDPAAAEAFAANARKNLQT
jgi:hypothetical protein